MGSNECSEVAGGSMRIALCIAVIAIAVFAIAVVGQSEKSEAVGSPEWIMKQAFSPAPRTANLSPYIGGELLLKESHQPNLVDGSFVDSGAVVTCRSLETTADHSTYAVFLREGAAFADMYCYLHKDTVGWKLVGIRSLAQTWVIDEAIKQLKSKSSLTDSEKWDMANAELTVASDSALKAHFQTNQATFSKIAGLVRSQHSSGSASTLHNSESVDTAEIKTDSISMQLRDLARKVMVTIAKGGQTYSCQSGLTLLIGGVMDNTVGYLYIPDSCTVPTIWNDGQRPGTDIIYIEQIAPGWYLYKST
jgi:hypothetical protein